MKSEFKGGIELNKTLYNLMEYRWFYRLMPRWWKFLYSFDVMNRNQEGTLHLGNGYGLDFKNMTINKVD